MNLPAGGIATPTETTGSPLDQVITLLKAKDDTSRFVGLSLLRSLLDSRKDLREAPQVVLQSWRAISKSFLVRLLESSLSKKIGVDDARNMKQLAVAIIHTYANLLGAQELDSKAMAAFCRPLVLSLPDIEPTSQMLVFQTLQCIGVAPAGAASLIAMPVLRDEFLDFAKGNEQHLQETAKLLRILRVSGPLSRQQVSDWDTLVLSLIERVKDEPAQVFEMLTDVMNSPEFMANEAPKWLDAVLDVLRQQITQRPAARVRTAAVLLAGSMLHHLPPHINFARILFQGPAHPERSSLNFPHLFVKLILIDIRSTIPELMSTLTAPSYSSTALRLAASYDIVGMFLYILLQTLGEDEEEVPGSSFEALIPPDLLLKLRSDLSETFSLTLEYMRDRWDASIAGTAGLHSSAQGPQASSAIGPLLLTWDNPAVPPTKDPIILAGLRAIALWLREDDNEMLRKQALGVLDMLLALYKLSSEGQEVDFRSPVLTALTGVLPSSDIAVDDFLEQDGWAVLANDLNRHLSNTSPHVHAQDLVRALLAVVESEAVTQSRENWMQLISSAAEATVPALRSDLKDLTALEDIISVYQLAIAIYLKAPKRLQRLFKSDMEQIRWKATSIYAEAAGAISLDSPVVQDAEDVLAGLATLPE